MKTKVILLSFAAALILSCNASKTAVAETPPTPPQPVEVAAAPASEAHAKGQSLYENNCAKCHKLFAATDFSQQEWKPILVRMQKKARLEDADMGLITNYIFDIQKN